MVNNIRKKYFQGKFKAANYGLSLYFLGNIIAFETAGTDFKGNGGSPDFCLYLDQVGLPGPAGMIFGMADLVSGHGVFSANIAGP